MVVVFLKSVLYHSSEAAGSLGRQTVNQVAECLNNPVPVVKIMWLESTTGLMFKLGRRRFGGAKELHNSRSNQFMTDTKLQVRILS